MHIIVMIITLIIICMAIHSASQGLRALSRRRLLWPFALALLTHCGSTDVSINAGSWADSGHDAGKIDGGPRVADAGSATDAGPASPADAGPATALDAGSFTPIDAGGTTTVDAGLACGTLGLVCCRSATCTASGLVCLNSTCQQAVQPFDCAGATGAVFVSEEAPPASMEPSQPLSTSVTFANCTAELWVATAAGAPDGFKLGFDAPRDSATWGPGRIALPGSVAPGHTVTVHISGRATPLTGPAPYRWAIVHEGLAWLTASSPLHTVDVQAGPKTVALCPGVTADASGAAPASAAIQTCIDATAAGGTFWLPAGVYRITSALQFTKPITVRTTGTEAAPENCLELPAPGCAILRADDNLNVPRGFIRFGATTNVTLDHLVLDGNRGARLSSAVAATCASGTNGPGFNAATGGCIGCSFTNSVSARALCGTGWEWRGDQATITNCVFRENGAHGVANMWSDGLTISQSDSAVITGNRFVDNSDVDLITGGGTNSVISNNTIAHVTQAAFAGLMLDNFNGGTSGDFTGAQIESNTVTCGAQQCDFAIELGPHAWYLSPNTIGGTLRGNVAVGAKININVEGGGTDEAPLVLIDNVIGAAPAKAAFNCGMHDTTAFNVSPDSRVQVTGSMPTGSVEFHICP